MVYRLLELPHWDQLADPWGSAGTDPYSTQDCGEESCAEVAWYYRRLTLSAYQIRTEMPGHGNSGLTTGEDLAAWLRTRNITSTAMETAATGIRALIRREVDAGRPVIVLGWYAGPLELHWVVARGVGDGRVGFNDPWHGTYRESSWPWFTAHYGGQLVTTAAARPWWRK